MFRDGFELYLLSSFDEEQCSSDVLKLFCLNIICVWSTQLLSDSATGIDGWFFCLVVFPASSKCVDACFLMCFLYCEWNNGHDEEEPAVM